MKVVKVNRTDKKAMPKYMFSGKDKPSLDEWFEICKRFERHFDFTRVFGFDSGIIFTYYDWYSAGYKGNVCEVELRSYATDSLSLVMVLAILQKLHDLPDFVSIVED